MIAKIIKKAPQDKHGAIMPDEITYIENDVIEYTNWDNGFLINGEFCGLRDYEKATLYILDKDGKTIDKLINK